MLELLDRRRSDTAKRVKELRAELSRAEKLCSETACVYMTGSFSRGEASIHSDLDLFIASRDTKRKPGLSRLNEILIKADLITATRKLDIPDFSGDGEYLVHYPLSELTKRLGTQQDDAINTFTARILLLLESKPLLGRLAYDSIINDVIAAYWKDYSRHGRDFMPAFLANDILRMWRTFCVNYEARTQNTPPDRRAKRRLMNYKLKHSRLLTCYSALFYLLAVYDERGTVTPRDVATMVSITPTERLQWLLRQPRLAKSHRIVSALLKSYQEFLDLTDASKPELVRLFSDEARRSEYWKKSFEFGDLVFKVLDTIGKDNQLYRLLVV